MEESVSQSVSQLTGIEDDELKAVASLGRVLLSTTLLQSLGYYMKRAGLFPSSAEPGVGAFIGGIALPMGQKWPRGQRFRCEGVGQ